MFSRRTWEYWPQLLFCWGKKTNNNKGILLPPFPLVSPGRSQTPLFLNEETCCPVLIGAEETLSCPKPAVLFWVGLCSGSSQFKGPDNFLSDFSATHYWLWGMGRGAGGMTDLSPELLHKSHTHTHTQCFWWALHRDLIHSLTQCFPTFVDPMEMFHNWKI